MADLVAAVQGCGHSVRGFPTHQEQLLKIQEKFLTMRVVRHWNRLPRAAVDAPSLEVFKDRLDGTLSSLV